MAIDDAEASQEEFDAIIGVLESYTPNINKYIKAKNKLLNNVKKVYEGREKILEGFKNGIFPFDYVEAYEEQVRHEKKEKNIRNENGVIDYEKLKKLKNNPERDKYRVNLINGGLIDCKEEIEDMSEEEKEIKNPNEVTDIVENILVFNRQ